MTQKNGKLEQSQVRSRITSGRKTMLISWQNFEPVRAIFDLMVLLTGIYPSHWWLFNCILNWSLLQVSNIWSSILSILKLIKLTSTEAVSHWIAEIKCKYISYTDVIIMVIAEKESRVSEIRALVCELPEQNFRMLKLLVEHLRR